jgi:Ca2+-binding RTX toxin-like protein
MRRFLLTMIAALGLLVVPPAAAEEGVTLLLQGGPNADSYGVALSADGRTYEIASNSALEVGAGICWHPEGTTSKLTCEATAISGFEFNGGLGNDTVLISRRVTVPTTLRGGPGGDVLTGGNAADKLIGGPGVDFLDGTGGDDLIYGGSGKDTEYGRFGRDTMFGGRGGDTMHGGPGNDVLRGGPGRDLLIGDSGHDSLIQ